MLIQAEYADQRDNIKPGDVIAFSGKGPLSWAIRTFTGSVVSHIGITFEIEQGSTIARRVKLMESTTMDGFQGVQTSYLSARLREYPGPIWWLPLAKRVRENMDLGAFWREVSTARGRRYDYRSIGHFALDRFHLWANREDTGRLFCSELAGMGLVAAGVLSKMINVSEIRPVDLVSFAIYGPNLYQLRGPMTNIKRFNSVDPDDWRNR